MLIHIVTHRKGCPMTFATGLCIFVFAPLKWFLHLFGITAFVVLILLPLLLACFPETPKGAVLILTYAASIAMQISGSEWLPSRKGLVMSAFFGSIGGSFVILLISYQPLPVWDQLLMYIALALWSLALYLIDGILHRKTVEEFQRHIAKLREENA